MTTATASPPVAIPDWLPENYRKAMRVLLAPTFTMPKIPGWTDDPTRQLKHFQEIGAAWLYLSQRSICADQVGLGKLIEALACIQMMFARGDNHRTLYFTVKDAQLQGYEETLAFTSLQPGIAMGPKQQRVSAYNSPNWDVLFCTYPLLLRDYTHLRKLVESGRVGAVFLDEGSIFRHADIQTYNKVEMLTRGVPRIHVMDATPIQTSLLDIHSLTQVLHMNIFGPPAAFERQYIRRAPVKKKRGDTFVSKSEIVGYKNMDEFKQRIRPFVLRRTAATVHEPLPEIQPVDVWFDLTPEQQRYYDECRRGILRLFEDGKFIEARSSFCHLQYACDTTLAFGAAHPESPKIDWICEQLFPGDPDGKGGRFPGDLAGEKVVIFSQYKWQLKHLQARLRAMGIEPGLYVGEETDQRERNRIKHDFAEGDLQAIIGTLALERGLNLQRSAHLININRVWNPQRMNQLAGRLRRINSTHANVFVINLLTHGTIEEKGQRILQQRAAVPDYVFGETDQQFGGITDNELYDLIKE